MRTKYLQWALMFSTCRHQKFLAEAKNGLKSSSLQMTPAFFYHSTWVFLCKENRRGTCALEISACVTLFAPLRGWRRITSRSRPSLPPARTWGALAGFAPCSRKVSGGKMNIGGAAMIRRPFLREQYPQSRRRRAGKSRKPQACVGDYDYANGFLCSLAPLWLISFLVCLCASLTSAVRVISAVERARDFWCFCHRRAGAPFLRLRYWISIVPSGAIDTTCKNSTKFRILKGVVYVSLKT